MVKRYHNEWLEVGIKETMPRMSMLSLNAHNLDTIL